VTFVYEIGFSHQPDPTQVAAWLLVVSFSVTSFAWLPLCTKTIQTIDSRPEKARPGSERWFPGQLRVDPDRAASNLVFHA
jgi:hypothetical protein